jgi:hypothetical protein
VVKRSRPLSRALVSSSGRPGSKNGTSPELSRSTLSVSTSTPITSKPITAMQIAWVAPR